MGRATVTSRIEKISSFEGSEGRLTPQVESGPMYKIGED